MGEETAERTGQMKKRCHACLKILATKTPVGRRELCPFCGSDLHCCRNCGFYAKGAYNDCRESQAERVLEKSRSNFCDFFVFQDALPNLKETANKASAGAKLEALFKTRHPGNDIGRKNLSTIEEPAAYPKDEY